MHAAGGLNQSDLAAFAIAGQFDEASISLSLICDLSVGLVEQAFVADKCDQILVIAKAIGLSWETTEAVVKLNLESRNRPLSDLKEIRTSYLKLQEGAARKALAFYRLRERTAISARAV
jgi:hypothetical protein